MKRAFLAAIVMLTAAVPMESQTSQCVVPTDVAYKIDLATGRTDGPRVYKPNDQIRILLFNRNPLRDYDVEIKAVPLPEPALELAGTIFEGVAGIIKKDPEAGKKVAPAGVPAPAAGRAALTCDQLVSQAAAKSDIDNKKDAVVAALAELRANFTGYETKIKKAAEDSKAKEAALHAKAECLLLVSSFSQYKAALNWPAVKAARTAVDAKAKELGDGTKTGLVKELMDGRAVFNGERTAGCKAEFDEAEKPVKAALALARGMQGDVADGLKKHEPTQKALNANDQKMTKLLADTSKFHMTRVVGPYLDPTEVTLTAKSKKSGDKTFPGTPDATAVFSFGGRARFAISVGVAFSSLEGPEYDDITRFELEPSGMRVLDDDGEPKLGRVLGLVDDSENRVAPLLMLHTRFAEGKGVFSAYHVSLGLTARVGTASSAVEYLVGVSASLAEERFFITLGGYYGRVETIDEGFWVGALLPSEITELPVRDDREWAPGISLSYKIK
ncbi:MAG: hypothetical protein GY719_16305 [bacterium]|nr:hypothetical protein [bacterium]